MPIEVWVHGLNGPWILIPRGQEPKKVVPSRARPAFEIDDNLSAGANNATPEPQTSRSSNLPAAQHLTRVRLNVIATPESFCHGFVRDLWAGRRTASGMLEILKK
jgi:hypothetical protein